MPSNQLFITDFAFHSICVILTRLKRTATLRDFVEDVFINGAVTLASIKPEDTKSLIDAMDKYNLDFDDAYQYVAAEQDDLIIVSFDEDLDRTARGKKTPAEVMGQKAAEAE
ncbi:MAG: PIN domain-containing protein [Blastocatellales bacterium]|nr:PIN domain-containing protein [Blastocatellales bacterium]